MSRTAESEVLSSARITEHRFEGGDDGTRQILKQKFEPLVALR
jgi:hypothetical protein